MGCARCAYVTSSSVCLYVLVLMNRVLFLMAVAICECVNAFVDNWSDTAYERNTRFGSVRFHLRTGSTWFRFGSVPVLRGSWSGSGRFGSVPRVRSVRFGSGSGLARSVRVGSYQLYFQFGPVRLPIWRGSADSNSHSEVELKSTRFGATLNY